MPRLFAELGVPIQAVSVARPSLDDVFLTYTGTTIRDAEADGRTRRMRAFARARACERRSSTLPVARCASRRPGCAATCAPCASSGSAS